MIKTEYSPHSLPLPRAPLAGPENDGTLLWHILPNELKIKIMRQLVPCVPITDYDYQPGQATRRPDNEPWVSRQALAAACLTSRQLETICKPLLYDFVTLKDCRELLCLLRSLGRNPRLQARVSRFAWVYTIGDIDINQPIVDMGPMLEGLVAECCAVWPKTARDSIVAELFQLRQTDPTSFSLWKILGVVVGMLPRVQTLFLTHGGLQVDSRGFNYTAEHDAIVQLLTPALLPASAIKAAVTRQDFDRSAMAGSAARISRLNPQSLRMLEEIIIDLCDTAVGFIMTEMKTAWTLWFLILNCPRLRRVVLKGDVSFNELLDIRYTSHPTPAALLFGPSRNLQQLPQPVGVTVQELVMHRLGVAKWDFLPSIFPNLERLVTVFQDGEWRCHPKRPPPEIPASLLPPDLGRSITKYQGTLRSLTATGFLSNNGKTTSEGYSCNADIGHIWAITGLPPLLSPGLPQVPLTELTTDCVWLFGREDPSTAYEVPSLLPSSLVSLHLIDYWAVPVDEEVVERGERLGYYPMFPSSLTPIHFLEKVFTILHSSCAAEHARLKHITLSSPIFDETGRWSTPDTQPLDRADVQLWKENASNTFSQIGVRFSFTTMRELERGIRSSWACM